MDLSARKLYEEYRASAAVRDTYLERSPQRKRRFTGPYHGPNDLSSDADFPLEAHDFEYLSLVAPRIVFDNPRVRVTTTLPASMGAIARGLQHSLNRLIMDTEICDPLTLLAFDSLSLWGFGIVEFEPWKGVASEVEHVGQMHGKGQPWRPVLRHKTAKEAFWDHQAKRWQDRRFTGHLFARTKEDLLREATDNPESGWIAEAIREAAVDSHLEELGYEQRDLRDRGLIVGVQMWVPGKLPRGSKVGPEDGFHGTIFTLGVSAPGAGKPKAQMLRKPMPFFGPPDGPYELFGMYPVTDETFPLSPCVATEVQVEDLNDHVTAASHSAAQYKRLVFVDARDPGLIDSIKKDPDMFVVPVNGLDKQKVVQVELGGITQEQITYIGMARERLDRATAMQDAQRGNVTGAGTATENQIADQASETRMGFLKKRFTAQAARCLKKMAWYIYHSNKFAIPLGAEGAAELGQAPQMIQGPMGPVAIPAEPWFHGGYFFQKTGLSFEHLELKIEPYSMERTSEALQMARMQQAIQLSTTIAPIVPMNPHVRWKLLFQMIADTNNMPELAELIDFDMAAKLGGQMMALPGQAQVRATGDIGLGTFGPVQSKPRQAGPMPQGGAAPASGGLAGRSSGAAAGARATQASRPSARRSPSRA